MENINIQIIARMHSDFPTKFGIPRQSNLVENLESTIVFEPEFRNPDALRGLEGYSHLWIIWQFSEAVRQTWSPTVRPPRLGGNTRMGVFATRSPFRPNNLGLSCVKLVGIENTEKDGAVIIKAAGNMAYPMGYRNEDIASEICEIAHTCHVPFETVAGWGCDERSMLGAGARKNVPVLVSVPQLIGGGQIGISIADSISVAERCYRISRMLSDADVIIESAVALTQEIHDGPFETYTGHGIWAAWKGYKTYSLKDKTLIRFDLDENLKKAWDLDKNSGDVQAAIDKGLPKTKMSKIPFRMEMSAFSRLEKSIPVIGDIGVLWSILALKVSQALNIKLDFISYPQQTPNGKEMREWIVNNIDYIKMEKIKAWLNNNS